MGPETPRTPGTVLPRGSGSHVSSLKVVAFGGAMKTAVAMGSSFGAVIAIPNGPPSLAPSMSIMVAFGMYFCSKDF